VTDRQTDGRTDAGSRWQLQVRRDDSIMTSRPTTANEVNETESG